MHHNKPSYHSLSPNLDPRSEYLHPAAKATKFDHCLNVHAPMADTKIQSSDEERKSHDSSPSLSNDDEKQSQSDSPPNVPQHPLLSAYSESKRQEHHIDSPIITADAPKGLLETPPCVPFTAQTLFLPTDNDCNKSLLTQLEPAAFLPQFHGVPWHPLGNGVVVAPPKSIQPSASTTTTITTACASEGEVDTPTETAEDEKNEGVDVPTSTQPVPLVTSSAVMTQTCDTAAFGGQLAMCSMYQWMMAKAYIAKTNTTKSKSYTHPLVGAATMQYPDKRIQRKRTKRKRSSNHGSWPET